MVGIDWKIQQASFKASPTTVSDLASATFHLNLAKRHTGLRRPAFGEGTWDCVAIVAECNSDHSK